SNTTRTDAPSRIAAQSATRGYVVFVDTSRVVIDLAAADGVKLGTGVSLRRDKIAIVHPITGELLGELDEEVATGRVVEVRDKFSVVDVQKNTTGAQVLIKDRVALAIGGDLGAIEAAIGREIDSPVRLIREMGEFIAGAGGKRLRPILLLIAAR